MPFTPVTGRRLLTAPGDDGQTAEALIAAALQIAERTRLSSFHITFCTAAESRMGAGLGLLPRLSQQFHWLNQSYTGFDDFLGALSSRKRKAIRKERATAQSFGGTIHRLTGNAIEPRHWDAFWDFYQDTGSRKWGHPYLTRAFFDELHATMRDDILLILAERGGRPVAGALNFLGRDTLYGRYWGAVEDHPCLHFECCYYQAIDHAIAASLSRVEAGAQGEHKLARGYRPVTTYSAHEIADVRLERAVADYLARERRQVAATIEAYGEYVPFRKGSTPS